MENKKQIICNDTKETFIKNIKAYDKYLSSEHWRNLRKRIAYQRNFTCEKCNKKIISKYHIHHLTYENIGNEKDEDLMFLCEKCHNKIHNGKVQKKKIRKEQQKKNKRLSIPKNYIESNNYKSRNQLSKLKFLFHCLNNRNIFSDDDRNNIINHIENIIRNSK